MPHGISPPPGIACTTSRDASKDTNRFQALYRPEHAALKQSLRRGSGQLAALIHRSAWNRNSANFAFWGFSEVSLYGVLRSSTRAAVSLCHRPVFVWRTEVGELGEEVLVWSHFVLRHPTVRQDGEHVIAHIIGQQTTVVRVANRSRRVVGQDIR